MTPSRVLVVLDDCGPGDALFLSFCLTALRRAMPAARIDCLASARAATVVELMPIFDRVITSRIYEQRSRSRAVLVLRKLLAALRILGLIAGRYQLAVTFYWGTTLLNLLAWAAARGRSYGYENGAARLVRGSLGRYSPGADGIGQAVRLMAALGVPAHPEVAASLARGPVEDRPGAEATFALPAVPYAVIHIGSDWACQQWAPERWALLADHVSDALGLLPVFTGVSSERERIAAVRGRMRRESIALAGETDVRGLAEVIGAASLCVCVDSLAFEVAQAARVPSVVLAGQSRLHVSGDAATRAEVVNRTDALERAAILECKLRFVQAAAGGCLNFDCPMAELRGIDVADVERAIWRVVRRQALPASEVPNS